MNVRHDQIKQWKVKSEGFHNYSCSVQRYMPVAMFAVHNRFKPAIYWQISDTWKWAGYILGTICFCKHCKLWSWRTGSLEIVTERWLRPIKHSEILRKEGCLAVWAIQVLCWSTCYSATCGQTMNGNLMSWNYCFFFLLGITDLFVSHLDDYTSIFLRHNVDSITTI